MLDNMSKSTDLYIMQNHQKDQHNIKEIWDERHLRRMEIPQFKIIIIISLSSFVHLANLITYLNYSL